MGAGRVVCVGAPSAQFCSGRGLNYMQTFTAEATVVDTSGPSVSVVPDTPLARGEWVRGKQPVDFEAADNVGVRSAFANLAGIGRAEEARGCDYSQRIPCPNGRGQIQVETERAQDGSQQQTPGRPSSHDPLLDPAEGLNMPAILHRENHLGLMLPPALRISDR